MTQHIEDKLSALAAQATQGEIRCAIKGCHVFTGPHAQPVAGFAMPGDAAMYASLHNAAPALLAVVRAARNIAKHCGDAPCCTCKVPCECGVALSALDAMEV